MPASSPRIFISYCHENENHRARIRQFADQLRKVGLPPIIDQDVEPNPPRGWPTWSSQQVENADYVLVVCTPEYHARVISDNPDVTPGCLFEAQVIYNELSTRRHPERKYIPILMNGGSTDSIPGLLIGFIRYSWPDQFEELCQRLRTPRFTLPKLMRERVPTLPTGAGELVRAPDPSASRWMIWAPGPPSRFWAGTIGRIAWLRGQEAVRQLREASSSARIGNHLEDVLKEGDVHFRIPFQLWGTRPMAAFSDHPLVVVSGAAGAGKTRYFNELHRNFAEVSDLVAALPTSELHKALSSRDPALLWDLIVAQTVGRAKPGTLTRVAVAHAMNARRVVLMVDDVHTIGTVAELSEGLRAYLDRYHRPGRGVTVVMTTRETLARDNQTPGVEVIRLEPLNSIEAAEFFWFLCEENAISIDPARIGPVLAEAFQSITTRTPLFVVICAWLAKVSPEYRVNLAGLLRLRSTEVFQRFINTLFTRAAKVEGLTFSRFTELYRELALVYWPAARGLPKEEVGHTIMALQNRGELRVPLAYFLENGFLSEDPHVLDLARVSFPHQAIADLLVAQRLVQTRDFSRLRRHGSATMLQGLPDVLGQLIDDPAVLLALAHDELRALVDVLEAHPTLLEQLGCRNRAWLGDLAEQAARWAGPLAPYPQSPDTWRGLNRLVGGDPVMRERFCAIVETTGPSAWGIEGLAVLDWPEGRRVLRGWMYQPDAMELLRSRLDSTAVRFFLTNTMRSGTPADRWRAFRAACKAPDSDLRQAVERYLEDAGASLTVEQLKCVASLDMSRLAALARGLISAPDSVKRVASSAVVSVTRKALLSPGLYTVIDGNQKIQVHVAHPVLVSQSPTFVEGPFHSPEAALSAVAEVVGTRLVLTRDQVLVLLQCYANPYLDVDPTGVVFHQLGEAGYEVVRDQRGEHVLLTIWRPRQTPATQTSMALPQTGTAQRSMSYPRVSYRLIELLQTTEGPEKAPRGEGLS